MSHKRKEGNDPLMPLLFCHRIQGELEGVATYLVDGEQLCAFLDDVYLLCEPARVEPLYKVLEEAMMRVAGIQLHQGKTRAWNQASIEPDNIADRTGGVATRRHHHVGTPIGSDQYIATKMDERIAKERRLWDAIPSVPDLQGAWHAKRQPCTNHSMRTLPPIVSATLCDAHDAGIWATAERCWVARQRATLPMRMGGLGSRSARCAPAAFWASWVDSRSATEPKKWPSWWQHRLTAEDPQNGCLEEF